MFYKSRREIPLILLPPGCTFRLLVQCQSDHQSEDIRERKRSLQRHTDEERERIYKCTGIKCSSRVRNMQSTELKFRLGSGTDSR